jgi:serine phosphatase RsbU (regulator of sigma subunit)
MFKLLSIFIIITCIPFYLLAQNENTNHPRIIIFEKVGQKATLKYSDNVSIILGSNIKPEYAYFSYSNGKSSDEYVVELQTTEPLLKEIENLKSSMDSLKISENRMDKVDNLIDNPVDKIINHQQAKAKKSSIMNPSILNDSIQLDTTLFKQHNSIFEIGKYKKDLDTVKKHINNSKDKIEDNNLIITNNKNKIDTLRKEIERIYRTGENQNKLEFFVSQIDSLLSYNYELVNQNKNLVENNSLLEKELKLHEALYDSIKKLFIYTIAITFLIVILAIVLYLNYRQKRKFNIELSKINRRLEDTNIELNETNESLSQKNIEIETQNEQLYIINYEKDSLLQIINDELVRASEYILSLLPKPINNGKIQTDWFFKTSDELGGDIFGYKWIDDENFIIYLLDVSGHGIGPALHSVQILNNLQNMTLPNVDFKKPDEVVSSLNKLFQMELHHNFFFTMCYCVYNTSTKLLRYSTAGHPPIILFNSNALRLLDSRNTIVGASENVSYNYNEILIDKPTSLFLYTDGVFEIKKLDGKMYTMDEFHKQLVNNIEKKHLSLDSLYDYAKTISGRLSLDDDFTILKIKI